MYARPLSLHQRTDSLGLRALALEERAKGHPFSPLLTGVLRWAVFAERLSYFPMLSVWIPIAMCCRYWDLLLLSCLLLGNLRLCFHALSFRSIWSCLLALHRIGPQIL